MNHFRKYAEFCIHHFIICLAALGFNALFGYFRSVGASYLQVITDSIETGNTEKLAGIIFLGGLLQGSSYVLRWLGAITPEFLSCRFGYEQRQELMEKLKKVSFPWFEAQAKGNLQSIIRRDSYRAGETIYAVFSRILSNLCVLIFSIIVMARTSVLATVITILSVCGVTWVNQLFLKYLSRWTKKSQAVLGQATDTLERTYQGLETIKTHRAGTYALDRYTSHIKAFCGWEKKAIYLDIVRDSVLTIVSKCILYIPLIVLGLMGIRGEMSVGTVVVFVYLAREILNPIAMLFRWTAHIARFIPSFQRVQTVLEEKDEETHSSEQEIPLGAAVCEAKNLSYQFEEGMPVFDQLSISLHQNEITRLVGESGSGKTTLMKVLMGLYPCKGATYQIDGQKLDSLRSNLTYTCLDQSVFAMTIFENISMGRENVTRAACKDMIHQLGFDEWISSLNLGIDTLVRPDELSGGQKQMISLCRAFLSSKPIILLDEPFSALDAEKRDKVWKLLEQMKKERLFLIISHGQEEESRYDQVIQLGSAEA